MGSKSTTTQEVTIRKAGGQEQSARNLLDQLAKGGMGQLGDLGALASGQLSLSGNDMALIRQIQELSSQQARDATMQNYEQVRGQVESGLLDRGLANSSVEAVSQALLGQQLQASLDQQALQGQITSAQQLRQQAIDRAGLQLNANQLLLNEILSGAGALANMGLQERLAQTTTKQTTKTPMSIGGAAQMVGRGLAAYGTGGASEVAAAGAPGMQGPSVQGPPIG